LWKISLAKVAKIARIVAVWPLSVVASSLLYSMARSQHCITFGSWPWRPYLLTYLASTFFQYSCALSSSLIFQKTLLCFLQLVQLGDGLVDSSSPAGLHGLQLSRRTQLRVMVVAADGGSKGWQDAQPHILRHQRHQRDAGLRTHCRRILHHP
jgi:hypothetical protein